MPNEPGAEAPRPDSALTDPSPDLDLASYRAQREAKAAAPAQAPAPVEQEPEKQPSDAPSPAEEEEDESAADSEPADTATEPDKPKGKGGFQRKISKLTRERDHWKALAEKPAGETKVDPPVREAVQDAPSAPPAATPEVSGFQKAKPKLEDFDSLEAFTDSLTDWKLEKKDFDTRAKEQERQARDESDKLTEGWRTRKAEAQKRHADFDEVLESVSDLQLSAPQQFALLESEHGPEIAYQLAQDPKELKRAIALPPLAFAREIGRREALLADSSEEAPDPETKVSRAPAPMRPLGAARTGAGGIDPAKVPLGDYRRARESGRLV